MPKETELLYKWYCSTNIFVFVNVGYSGIVKNIKYGKAARQRGL